MYMCRLCPDNQLLSPNDLLIQQHCSLPGADMCTDMHAPEKEAIVYQKGLRQEDNGSATHTGVFRVAACLSEPQTYKLQRSSGPLELQTNMSHSCGCV